MVRAIPAVSMERLYARVLPNYIGVAISDFELPFPFDIELGIKGLAGVYVIFPSLTGLYRGPIHEDAFRRTFKLSEGTPDAISKLLSQYFHEFYDALLACRRRDYITDQHVKQYELPPLV